MTLRFKRRSVLALVGLLVLLVWGAFQYVPVVFNLNTYKSYLEARLTRELRHPVRLGQIQLSLLQGVRLRILGFEVLSENGDPILLRAREVSAGLKLLPLLHGQILLHRVTLDGPYARLWLDADGTLRPWKRTREPGAPARPVRRFPLGFALTELVVKDGTVDFTDERDGADSTSFQARGINGLVRFTSPDGSSFVKVSAELLHGQHAATLSVTANVEPESGGEEPSPLRASGHLRCVGADADQFWRYCRRWIPFREFRGRFDIETDFSFDGHGHFKTTDGALRFTNLLIDYPKAFRTPFVAPVGSIRWEMAYDGTKLDFPLVDVDLNEMNLRGRFAIDQVHSGKERSFESEFSTLPFSLREGVRYFPSALLPERSLTFIEEKISAGMLEIQGARIAGKISDIRKMRDHPSVVMAEVAGTGFSVYFSKNVAGEGLSFGATLEDGTLKFHADAGTVEGFSVRRVEGEIASLFRGPMLRIEGTADVPLAEVERTLPRWIRADSRFAFLLDFQALQGSAVADVLWKHCWREEGCSALTGGLDLVDVGFRHPRFGLPVEYVRGRVELSGEAISIPNLEATIGESPVRLTMRVEGLGTGRPTYDATYWSDLAPEDLSSLLGPLFPRKLALQGLSLVTGSVQGTRDRLRLEVTADLTDASYEYAGVFRKPAGKANKVSFVGSAVEGDEVVVDEVVFRLGDSTITAAGTVRNLADPVVDLRFLTSAAEVADFCERNPYWKPSYPVAGRVSGEASVAGPARNAEALVCSVRADVEDMLMALPGVKEPVVIHKGKLKYADGELVFNPLELQLGQSHFRVSGKVTEWDHPRVLLEVLGDSVMWEDLALLKGNLNGGSRLEFLKKLRLDAQLRFNTVRLKHMTLQRFRTHLLSDGDGVLEVKNVWFDIGGGKVIAHASVNLDGADQPTIQITDVHAMGLDVEHLLDSARPGTNLFTGELHASAEDLRFVRNGSSSFLGGLNGAFQVKIVDGTVKRYKILATIFSIMNFHKILQEGLPDFQSEGLDFHSIEGSFVVRDGVLYTSDLALDSNAVRIRAMGRVNLPARRYEPLQELQERYTDLNGMLVIVQPFYTVDSILSRIPFLDFLAGDNRSFLGAFFEVSGPLDAPEVRSLQIRSLEAGVRDRLKRLLRGGLRLFSLGRNGR